MTGSIFFEIYLVQYDIIRKKLLEYSLPDFFKEIIGVEIQDGEILEELPTERPVVKRTDYPVLVTDSEGQKKIYIVELQTHWREAKLKDLILQRRKELMIQSPVYDMILEEGIEKGFEQGVEKGIEQGIHEKALEDARNLIRLGVAPEIVLKATGLSKEEIEEL